MWVTVGIVLGAFAALAAIVWLTRDGTCAHRWLQRCECVCCGAPVLHENEEGDLDNDPPPPPQNLIPRPAHAAADPLHLVPARATLAPNVRGG